MSIEFPCRGQALSLPMDPSSRRDPSTDSSPRKRKGTRRHRRRESSSVPSQYAGSVHAQNGSVNDVYECHQSGHAPQPGMNHDADSQQQIYFVGQNEQQVHSYPHNQPNIHGPTNLPADDYYQNSHALTTWNLHQMEAGLVSSYPAEGQEVIEDQTTAWEHQPWPGNSSLLSLYHPSYPAHSPVDPTAIEAARIARTQQELDRIAASLP